MSRELLGVIAKFDGRGCIPMIGAQHGSQVIKIPGRAALCVQTRPIGRRADAQMQGIGRNSPAVRSAFVSGSRDCSIA